MRKGGLMSGGGSTGGMRATVSVGAAALTGLAALVTASALRFGEDGEGRAGPAGEADGGRWEKLVEECVEILDQLDGHMGGFDAPRREVAGHVISRLGEALARSGVEVISDEATFDRARHRPEAADGAPLAIAAEGAAVAETVSPGFAVGRKILRRARVRVEQGSKVGQVGEADSSVERV